MAPPGGTDDENQRPEEKDDSVKLVAPQLAKMPGIGSGPESFRLSLRVGQPLRYSSTFALCFDL